MQSLNRIQNRPQIAFRKTPGADAPAHYERLEQRVLFNGDVLSHAEPMNPNDAPALVYEMHPGGAASDLSPLCPAVPTLRDLNSATASVRISSLPTFTPVVLSVPGGDDVLVSRHETSVWSTPVDQPVASLKTKVREQIDVVTRDIGPLPPSGKGLVLLVEDDDASRNALSTILRRRGWRVESAGTLSEGMRLLDTHPDRVIVDLNLPDGDGGKIVQQLEAEGLSSRAMVMTGVSDPARLARVKAMHPGSVLQKPVSVPALLHDLAAGMPAMAA